MTCGSSTLPAVQASSSSPWSDREITRFTKRVALFKRRGQTEERAESIAESLIARDRDRDDRRLCIECSHLQRDGGCFAARQGWIHGASRQLTPVQNVLQRCERFDWAKP
jgi:hypothetical protein